MKNPDTMASTCYCGQSGDITLNMLECAKCKRWYHEECVKCLELPMLLGDTFYLFVCSVCNAGSEYLGRVEMNWNEVCHLLLYNLTVLEKKKYFHIDTSIVPFLQENWDRFQLFGSVVSDKKDMYSKVIESLQNSSNLFKCGKEVKKSKSIWALRIRTPPKGPQVSPSTARLQKDVIIWEFQVKGRACHIIGIKKPKSNGKSKSKPSARHKNGEAQKCHGSLPHNENGVHKSKHRLKRTTVVFNEESARSGLLDSLIPCPPNFSICNNPFQKSLASFKRPYCHNEKNSEAKRQRTGKYDLTFLNGNHPMSDDTADTATLFTKEISLHKPKDDFCIMGKRTTPSGKVQYLLQRNRAKMEEVVAEKDPLFQITFMCKCCYCKREIKQNVNKPIVAIRQLRNSTLFLMPYSIDFQNLQFNVPINLELKKEVSTEVGEVDVHNDRSSSPSSSTDDESEFCANFQDYKMKPDNLKYLNSSTDSELETDCSTVEEDIPSEEDVSTSLPYENESFNEPLYRNSPLTVSESNWPFFSFVQNAKLSGTSLLLLLQLIELHCPKPNLCTSSIYSFKKHFKSLKQEMKQSFYCSVCNSVLSKQKISICPSCQQKNPQANSLIDIPIEPQLSKLFSRDRFVEKLQHRFNRKKCSSSNYEDVYDGSVSVIV